jgi:FAD/FMN-containing dehydrogenase
METMVFTFDSFSDASAFAGAVLATKLLPAALEVANRAVLDRLDFKGSVNFTPGPCVVMLALEAFEEAVVRMRNELQAMARSFKALGHALIQEDEHRLFWLNLGEIQSAWLKRSPRLVTLQLNYPLSAWKGLFEFASETLSRHKLEHTLLCHSGSGVTLINLLPDTTQPQERSITEAVRALLAECRKTGGNLVVQGAPTDLKGDLPVWGEPGSDLPLIKRIKVELDPFGVMNPGRFAAGL